MLTYLVTGAAGFIGSNFVRMLREEEPEVRIVAVDKLTYAGNYASIADLVDNEQFFVFHRADICDAEAMGELFAHYTPQYVINFAAESHVDRSIEDPQLFLRSNILGVQVLLDAARKQWQQGKDEQGYPLWPKDHRFLQVSTDEVYGSLGPEGYFTETTPLAPRSPYSASKASADFFVQAAVETFHFPGLITRCSNNYGPYQFPEKLIPLVLNNILQAKSLPVYGDGSNVRDWLYVTDHCRAIRRVLLRGKVGQVYNVGGHNEYSNLQLVHIILETVRSLMEENPKYRDVLRVDVQKKSDLSWIGPGLISFVKDRLGHDARYAIDPQKISEQLDWEPTTDFPTGIVKTVRWYLEHQDWVRGIVDGDYQDYYRKMYSGR
ncbi:dTDP-glucose 4,6-dehydratase [Porphyromonas crevioricanis JCM 15906]|uniref:dTDP-glucose 4,6-dehydratase n=1 Tax=Porphyromonas crevioricanis JCM 15906 TaxID=1305617 RepID=T1DS44_9PORP|nr:dTDP-glucose 4,6-dehydratase [Porphyromonas crevioricanis]GAD05124.1 dTDP-glucose 4,6-dehydratase [Porphyromonas crevioricanis JCM 15906]SJZ84227.1 dTDP-glucose 4,6-dehydratase [Porphyromonas crevioricanis]